MITAIICEYNPFHNGHLYQIQELKKKGHTVICFMSGNFVQRGEMAIFDKYTRAKAAILSGCDLVLEIPIPFSISSAERFAFNCVKILNEMNFIDNLSFGCENEELEKFYIISEFLSRKETLEKIKENQKLSIPYPKAIEKIIREALGEEFSNIIKKPNNILAIEYIKAILKIKSNINPMPLKRNLIGHNETFNKNMASATYIRNLIKENKLLKASKFVPKNCLDIYKSQIKNGYLPSKEKFDNALLFYLKKLNLKDIKRVSDVENGFENKIFKSIKTSKNIDEFYNLISDKYHTKSNIRRIALNILLDFTKDDLIQKSIFVKLLGFRKNSKEIFKNFNKQKKSLIISSKINQINDRVYCEKISNAYDIYNILLQNPKESGLEYTSKIIKL